MSLDDDIAAWAATVRLPDAEAAAMASHWASLITGPRFAPGTGTGWRTRAGRRALAACRPCLASRISSSPRIFIVVSM